VVIAFTGPPCAGKSTLAAELLDMAGATVILDAPYGHEEDDAGLVRLGARIMNAA
jgi:hypothetical protein